MNLHLVDTQHGRNIWSERYEGGIDDLFAIQGDIVGRVVSALGGLEGHIADAERRRLGRRPPEDLKAYELYLLALELEERHQKESTLEAFALLQRALSLDPKLARAWLVLGWACHQIWSERWTDDPRYYATWSWKPTSRRQGSTRATLSPSWSWQWCVQSTAISSAHGTVSSEPSIWGGTRRICLPPQPSTSPWCWTTPQGPCNSSCAAKNYARPQRIGTSCTGQGWPTSPATTSERSTLRGERRT
jgi:hypothetical protein